VAAFPFEQAPIPSLSAFPIIARSSQCQGNLLRVVHSASREAASKCISGGFGVVSVCKKSPSGPLPNAERDYDKVSTSNILMFGNVTADGRDANQRTTSTTGIDVSGGPLVTEKHERGHLNLVNWKKT
jgi:hypothetical protein